MKHKIKLLQKMIEHTGKIAEEYRAEGDNAGLIWAAAQKEGMELALLLLEDEVFAEEWEEPKYNYDGLEKEDTQLFKSIKRRRT